MTIIDNTMCGNTYVRDPKIPIILYFAIILAIEKPIIKPFKNNINIIIGIPIIDIPNTNTKMIYNRLEVKLFLKTDK